jgi:hypothetical protein
MLNKVYNNKLILIVCIVIFLYMYNTTEYFSNVENDNIIYCKKNKNDNASVCEQIDKYIYWPVLNNPTNGPPYIDKYSIS